MILVYREGRFDLAVEAASTAGALAGPDWAYAYAIYAKRFDAMKESGEPWDGVRTLTEK